MYIIQTTIRLQQFDNRFRVSKAAHELILLWAYWFSEFS